jgi:cytochrome c oxidase subunit 3
VEDLLAAACLQLCEDPQCSQPPAALGRETPGSGGLEGGRVSTFSEVRPAVRPSTARLGFFLILASESVFFVTLLVAYAAMRDQAAWPLQATLARLAIPLVNTAILLVSALAARGAVSSIQRGRIRALQGSLLLTLLLGSLFVVGQVYEFTHAGLQIGDPAFGGVFFILMGFHAVHVLAGMVFLIMNLVRSRLGDFSPGRCEAVELGSWFWYYVAAVWVALFIALYLV